jgi:hypothetical protein
MYDWIKSVGLKAPSKVAVANWLVENGRSTPSAKGSAVLVSLHANLVQALGIEGNESSMKSGRAAPLIRSGAQGAAGGAA